jgi:competence protein ComFC
MLNNLIQLIYPNLCRSCQKIIYNDAIFCHECHSKIKLVVPLFLPLTQQRSLSIYAASAYQDPVKALVFKKFSHETLACRQLADLMYEFIPFDTIKPDFFIPIPLHWTRFAWRGYNQSDLMATRLAERLGVPVFKILKRSRRTVFQSQLSAKERQKNVADVFILKNCDLAQFSGKNLVIVDDLFTSGATIKSAAKILLQLKPNSITATVACRVV